MRRPSPGTVAGLALGLSPLVMLWPLPLRLGSAVVDHYFWYDALLTSDNLLGLAKNALRGQLGAALWDGPFFWPQPGVLAFTEPDWVPALLAAPFGLSGAPVLGHNLVLLSGFSATALACYALFLHLTAEAGARDPLAAAIAAFAATYSAFRWAHVDHLNYAFAPFAPLLVLALLRYFGLGRWRDAVLFAVTGLLQAVTCLYSTLFLAACLPPVAIAAFFGARREGSTATLWRFLVPVAVAGGLAFAALSPYARIHREQGVTRDLDDVVTESGELQQLVFADVLQRPMGSILPDKVRWDSANYPGLFALALCAWLLARQIAKRERLPAGAKRMLLFSAVAFLLFFGPFVKLNFTPLFRGPFWWLWHHVPGYDGIRAVRRIASLLSLGLCAAAAPALALLARGRARLPALAGFGALALVEGWAAPLPLREVPTLASAPPAYRWLAANADQGPVIELPPKTHDSQGTLSRLMARVDGHPTLDGHSGFHGSFYRWLRGELLAGNLDVLRGCGARYLLVDRSRPGADAFEARLRSLRWAAPVEGVDGLFEVRDPAQLETAAVPAGLVPIGVRTEPPLTQLWDGDPATRWSPGHVQRPGDSLDLVFDDPTDLAAVSVSPGLFSLDFPRGLEVRCEIGEDRWRLAGTLSPPLLDLALRPLDQPVAVPVGCPPARRWRISVVGRSSVSWWSIAELRAYKRR